MSSFETLISPYRDLVKLISCIDQEWLDTLNAERKKDQSGPVSYEVFEIIMDKLEKEWFNLVSWLTPDGRLTYSRRRGS